jgi:7-keto-8-aminopelargonate synthetase-like enzyme
MAGFQASTYRHFFYHGVGQTGESLWLAIDGGAANLSFQPAESIMNISGNTYLHERLEAEIADLHGREAHCLFTSGFVANEAALSTLVQAMPGMIVASDALNHPSMIAGIRNSRVEKYIFRHNDFSHLINKIRPLSTGSRLGTISQSGSTISIERSDRRPTRP